MKKIVAVFLVVVLAVCMFAGCEDARVEAKVISCEEGTPYVNGAAKVKSTMDFVNGNYSSAMMWGAVAQPQDRYKVVVEYEGEQYTITTSNSYEVGETILVDLTFAD